MKKLLAIVALVAFLGGMSAPVLAKDNTSVLKIELADKDPKKAKKTEKKSDAKQASSDCEKTCEKSCDGKK